jgi:hypothetical protein
MPAGENEPTAFRPPGYPVLLAGVHAAGAPLPVERWTRGRVANALLGTLAVALVGLIAMHFWSRRVALVAMTVMAVDLSLVLVGGSLMSDTLFVALTLGAVLAALRSRSERRPIAWAAGAGALIGLATLTRPNGLLSQDRATDQRRDGIPRASVPGWRASARSARTVHARPGAHASTATATHRRHSARAAGVPVRRSS